MKPRWNSTAPKSEGIEFATLGTLNANRNNCRESWILLIRMHIVVR